MNDSRKWSAIRNMIEESVCVAFCFQETKKSSLDITFLKNFCPRYFNKFEFVPSVGASGGLLTVWNSSQFIGELIYSGTFAITIKLTSQQSGQQWFLTNIYGPCSSTGRAEFTNWLYNLDSLDYDLWLMVGDFNLMRSPANRNRPGGDTNNMLLFNDIISHLDMVEVPLKNRSFIWSNMQQNALLEKLDWVFTSSNWMVSFPNTLAFAMSHAVSDHVTIVIQMESVRERCAAES
jgi:hypothetical protein